MTEPLIDPDCRPRTGKHSSCVGGPCECACHVRAEQVLPGASLMEDVPLGEALIGLHTCEGQEELL